MKKLLVIFAAVAFIWVFAAPASALDWNFYGSARLATFYTSTDLGDITTLANGDDEDDEFTWDMQSNSRIGATVKGENISGRFELGITQTPDGSSDDAARVRRLFGVWDAGWGKIKVGKDYTPTSQFISGQVFAGDLGLLGIGTFYGGRKGQAALSIGGFEIALITQGDTAPVEFGTGTSVEDAQGDYDRYMPKVEAKFGMAWDTFNFNVMGGFQYVEWEDVQPLDPTQSPDDVDVTSWVLGADAGITFGPLYFKGAVSYTENPFTADWLVNDAVGDIIGADFWDGDDDIDDFDYFQGALVAGFKLSDMVTFEVGGGYTNVDIDAADIDDFNPWAIYGQAVIGLAPGVHIIPEVGYFDFDELDNGVDADLPTQFYIGAKWQIDF
jgi:hypothetical protein